MRQFRRVPLISYRASQVMDLAGEGLDSIEIAARLGVSRTYVYKKLEEVRLKLDACCNTSAMEKWREIQRLLGGQVGSCSVEIGRAYQRQEIR